MVLLLFHNRPGMQDLFHVAPLSPKEAHLAYPLVQMFDPAVTLQDWVTFARRLARRKPGQGGLMAARDRRGVLHALFAYAVDRDRRATACLRVTDLIVSRLPGEEVNATVLSGVQELADRLGCKSVLIDVPVMPGNAHALLGMEGLAAPNFSPVTITFGSVSNPDRR
ncbi:hypothetical protein [Microvirga terricola]|uniref:GNAT family N-acetyltransferase n=1 Tax=Microvirga terricola TaxID=2719797 RepID=A0ABX0VH16_9HYPH|nr:hypothetical protein [Microvirga terricola]NIX77502.1 hypothetical protein [Microvirga terricola]